MCRFSPKFLAAAIAPAMFASPQQALSQAQTNALAVDACNYAYREAAS